MINNRILRKVLGATWEELTGRWNKPLYAELRLFSSLIIIGVIKNKGREVDKILNLYKILVRKMKRGIPLRLLFGNNKCGSLSAVLFPCF